MSRKSLFASSSRVTMFRVHERGPWSGPMSWHLCRSAAKYVLRVQGIAGEYVSNSAFQYGNIA